MTLIWKIHRDINVVVQLMMQSHKYFLLNLKLVLITDNSEFWLILIKYVKNVLTCIQTVFYSFLTSIKQLFLISIYRHEVPLRQETFVLQLCFTPLTLLTLHVSARVICSSRCHEKYFKNYLLTCLHAYRALSVRCIMKFKEIEIPAS